MASAEQWVEAIRARVRAHPKGFATLADLQSVEIALAAHPDSPALWILRGDLIQLDDSDSGHYRLEDALESYVQARALDPTNAEAHEEIGHHTDAMADDPEGALPHYRKAIALGGGDSAIQALTDALAEMSERTEE